MTTKKPQGKAAKRAKNTPGNARVGSPDVKVFIAEYLIDSNGRRAAIAAGYSPRSADSTASRLLRSDKVKAEIAKVRTRVVAMVEERVGITLARVVEEAANILRADPRDLSEWIVGCCRHCHGEGFKRQRTVAELNSAYEKWVKKPRKELGEEFDQEGGIGFYALRAPHPSCPECAGYGQGRAILKDTRSLSPSALALFAGIKQTKEGVQVLTHSKLDALEKLLKHLGGYKADYEGKASSFAEALAGFVSQMHSAGGSKLPIRPPLAKS